MLKGQLPKVVSYNDWQADNSAFLSWLSDRDEVLNPGLAAEPTIKVLIFLALLDSDKPCSYDDLRKTLKEKKVIKGIVPDNTFRTSVMNLGKTLDKFSHPLELKARRGMFQLISRKRKTNIEKTWNNYEPVFQILTPRAVTAEEIACQLIETSMLPFQALYFLEWAARWWEIFSSNEAQIRVPYEIGAWEKLGIGSRILAHPNEIISIVGLASGEGLAEIELIKKILYEHNEKKVHYIAIDTSQRLLRGHINLLKETLATEIQEGRLICAAAVADIFSNLRDAIHSVKNELVSRNIVRSQNDFLPNDSALLITYLGNCLGNNLPDHETKIFSIIYSIFSNRPLDFMVGVSTLRHSADVYKRNWDDFLLQTPRHLLEVNKSLYSARPADSKILPEFKLPKSADNTRCPAVIPEKYIVRHQIEGQIYRFYYRLSFDLSLSKNLGTDLRPLPKGTLILLYNIIKYQMKTLVSGIEMCGLFKIEYDANYHLTIDTMNGIREYAVFSAFLK